MSFHRSVGLRLLAALLTALAGCLSSLAASEFQLVDHQLTDPAVLVTIDEGVRRVRLQARDPETGEWETITIAHLDGRAGHMKLRLPDGKPMGDLRCEISRSDPFPASFYQGSTAFSDATDQSNPLPGFVNRAGPEDVTFDDSTSGPAVVESDIWKWKDRTLYFFNTYRGLQVIDLTDPSNPTRTATLRMPAVGEEMYLTGDNHVVLLAIQGSGWYGSGSIKSEIVLVRHEDDNLSVSGSFEVDGTFVESRMVGDVLYAVTRFWEQWQDADEAWQTRTGLKVNVLDLTDPENPVRGETLELMGDQTGYFYNAVVNATPDHLFVVPSTYDNASGTSRSEVHVIDISNPGVPLKVRSRIQLRGQLNDKFKMRERDGILTTITQLWGNTDATRLTHVENFDLRSPNNGNVPLLGSVSLAPGETVRATRFDQDRVYVVTFRQVDPLFVVDLADPQTPTVLGELEIPGWSTWLEPMGTRLLSVGVEDSRVAVSLFDVGNPETLSMLARVHLGEKDGYSWSEANYDEKAIGHFPDEELLVLPFATYMDGAYQTRMQLIDVGPDGLTRRGVIDSEFSGRRSQLFDSSLVAVSGRELQVVDIGDRNQPELTDRLSLAWPVDAVVTIGNDHIAQFANGNWNWWGGQSKPTTMRITRNDDVDTVVAELGIGDVGQIAGVVGRGHHLFLLTVQSGVLQTDTDEGRTLYEYETSYRTTVIDVENPEEPVELGFAESTVKGYTYGSQSRGHFLPEGELLWTPDSSGSAGPIWGHPYIDGIRGGDIWWPNYGSSEGTVLVIRIDDPANPSVIATMSLSGSADPGDVYRETGPVFLESDQLTFGYRQGRWEQEHYVYNAYIQKIDLSDPDEPRRSRPVNVPGLLQHMLSTPSGGDVLFTTRQKIEFDEVNKQTIWSPDAVLEASVFDGLSAFLVDQIEIADGAYSTLTGYDRFLLKPKDNRWWSDEETGRGIQFIEWNNTAGEFLSPEDIILESPPQSLVPAGDLLFAFGPGGVDALALHQLPADPSVISFQAAAIGSSWGARSVELNQEAKIAWIPVGIYGVESLDVSSLSPTFEERPVSGDEQPEWTPVDLNGRHLVLAGSEDYVGSVETGDGWRIQPSRARLDYQDWARTHFNPDGIPDLPLPPPSGDWDHDGWSNAAEFAAGTDPDDPAEAGPYGRMIVSGPAGHRTLAYTFTVNPSALGTVVSPEISSNLVDWRAAAETDGAVVIDDGWLVSVLMDEPVKGGANLFIRLRVEIP